MMEHTPLLRKEFASMVRKGQWVMLPYLVPQNLPGLRLSPRELIRKGTGGPGGWGTTVTLK